jgi:hypothetical protein
MIMMTPETMTQVVIIIKINKSILLASVITLSLNVFLSLHLKSFRTNLLQDIWNCQFNPDVELNIITYFDTTGLLNTLVSLPGMNDAEFYNIIVKIYYDAKVLLWSGYSMKGTV